MPMDAHLSAGQPAEVFRAERVANVEVYPPIPGNPPYHYSWHAPNRIVVGIGAGAGNHRNYTCNITNRFVVNLVRGGGGLAVGGAGGINEAALRTSVIRALKLRFRILVLTHAFNTLERSAQQVTFHNNPVVNRHATRRLVVGARTINAGQSHTFAAGTMNGFAVIEFFAGIDSYYRNYDVRENVNANNAEQLRVLHGAQVTLNGTHSGGINLHLL